MKNRDILKAFEGLMKIREKSEINFPARIAYAIARNIRILHPVYEDIVSTRIEILRKYGDPVPDEPGYFSPKTGEEQIMNDELRAIDEIESNCSDLQRISLSDLAEINFSVADMEALYFMVDES